MIRNVLSFLVIDQVMSRGFSKSSAFRGGNSGPMARAGRNYGYMTYTEAIPCFPEDVACNKEAKDIQKIQIISSSVSGVVVVVIIAIYCSVKAYMSKREEDLEKAEGRLNGSEEDRGDRR